MHIIIILCILRVRKNYRRPGRCLRLAWHYAVRIALRCQLVIRQCIRLLRKIILNSTCSKGLVKQYWGGPEKRRVGHQFWTPVRGWVVQFSAPRMGGWNWHTFDPIDNRYKLLPVTTGENWSSRGWKHTHGLCTIEMAISCIVKSARKLRSLTDWARSPRAEIFKILRSVDQLVFTNTKWPNCVYMLFVPKGTGHMFMDLELTLLGLGLVVCWLFGS